MNHRLTAPVASSAFIPQSVPWWTSRLTGIETCSCKGSKPCTFPVQLGSQKRAVDVNVTYKKFFACKILQSHGIAHTLWAVSGFSVSHSDRYIDNRAVKHERASYLKPTLPGRSSIAQVTLRRYRFLVEVKLFYEGSSQTAFHELHTSGWGSGEVFHLGYMCPM